MSVTVRIVDTGERVGMPAATSVPALRQFLASTTTVRVSDQLLLLGPSGTSVDDDYHFTESDVVYLYNKESLQPNSRVPQLERFPVVRTEQVVQQSPSADDVRVWSENPRLGAVLSFQRKFRHHRLRAESHMKAMQQREELCKKCLARMEVQMGGLQVAKHSLNTHKQQQLQRIEADSARFEAVRDEHRRLLEEFPAALEELRKTALHPSLRQGQWETLIDCVPDERNLSIWVTKCSEEHKDFGRRMEAWKDDGAALDALVQKELERRSEVPFQELTRSLRELSELIGRGNQLLQEISKDLTALTDLASGTSGSVSHSQVLENYDRHEERHSAFLEELAQLDSRSVEIYETFASAQARHAIFVHERLQVVSRLQSDVSKLYCESVIFEQHLEAQQKRFTYVEAVHRMPAAYRACEKHLAHRTWFKRELMQQVQKVNDRLREVLLQEQQTRDSFWSDNGAYLPKHLVPNLTSPVPNLSIHPDQFDDLLPMVECSGDEGKLVIAADPSTKSGEDVAEWKARWEAAQASSLAYEQQVNALKREVHLLQAELARETKKVTASETALHDSRASHRALVAGHESETRKFQAEILQLSKTADEARFLAAARTTRLEEEQEQLQREQIETVRELEETKAHLQELTETRKRIMESEANLRDNLQEELEKSRTRGRHIEELVLALQTDSPKEAFERAKKAAVTQRLDGVVAAIELAVASMAAIPELESKVATFQDSAEQCTREADAQKRENEKLVKDLALCGVQVAELQERLQQATDLVAKLEEDKTAAVSTRKSSENAARAAQKEASDARELLKETQSALDASNAELVVLKDELVAATKEVLAMKKALTETTSSSDALAQLKRVVADQQAAIEDARAKHCDMVRRLEASEAKVKTVERKAATRIEDLQNELKQVMQEKNETISASMQIQADLCDLRSSGNTNKFIVDRITALIRTMPQPLKTDLQISEMSDPAEVFSELLQRVNNSSRDGGTRPVVALTQFRAGDVCLFFKNPKGFYEAFNFESPHHYIAPESLECFEAQKRDNLCILGEVINIEHCVVIEDFENPYSLPANTPYKIVTVARCTLA